MNFTNNTAKFLLLGLCMNSAVFAGTQLISSLEIPAAVAPYSQAILSTTSSNDQTLYIAGVLPMLVPPATALVEDPAQATTLVMDHINVILQKAGMSWNNVVDVILLLRDLNDFKAVSDSYGLYLKSQNVAILPVRLCFQAGKLPLNAVIEMKATAVKSA